MNSLPAELPWDDLQLLLAVLEASSLSAAGDVLGLSQSTVSRRLRALETLLGGALVERGPLGSRPTARGAALAPMLAAMREAADGVRRVAEVVHQDAAGVVRVAAGDLIGWRIARQLPRLLAGTRGLTIELLTSVEQVNLARGEVEIALRGERPRRGPLFARSLGSTRYAVFGGASYVATHPDAWDDIARYRACAWVAHAVRRLRTASWLAERLDAAVAVQRFSSSLMILEAIAAGAGLGLLPVYVDDPRLVRLSEPLEDVAYQSWLVTHRQSRELPQVRLVADRLVQLLHGPPVVA